jgi:hypothetical protein
MVVFENSRHPLMAGTDTKIVVFKNTRYPPKAGTDTKMVVFENTRRPPKAGALTGWLSLMSRLGTFFPMSKQALLSIIFRLSFGLAVILVWGVPSPAQKSYPGWSAPKIIPTGSDLSTFPDIAAEGDTLHVVFRSTATRSIGSGGPTDKQLLIEESQKISVFLRQASEEEIQNAGGKNKLNEKRDELLKKIGKLPDQPSTPGSTVPVDTSICYTRSDDRGRTWLPEPIVIAKNPNSFMGQTAIHVDQNGLHVIASAIYGDNIVQIYYVNSTDGGKTWSAPTKISQSEFTKINPHLVPTAGNGLLACWWELEQTEIEQRTRATVDSMDDFIKDPNLVTTTAQRSRSKVHIARMVGGTWQVDQPLDIATDLVKFLNLAVGPEGAIIILWLDGNGLDCRVSKDGGQTWTTALNYQQIIDPEHFTTFVYGDGEFHFIRAHIDKDHGGQLSYHKGLPEGEWTKIIDEETQSWYPQLAYTKNEIQVVWGITDSLAGKHIYFLRQDNKPPKSELYYPRDGNFTKNQASFVWGATDDISTKLTYRWCRVPRKDPNTKAIPERWTLYDEVNNQSDKAPEDGHFTFFLQAVDFSGNEETNPIAYDYHTYFVPPRLSNDLSVLPPLTIQSRSLEIRWKAEDNQPGNLLQVAYQVDGNPLSHFSQIDNVQISGLPIGWHQIQLFAKDAHGNVSTFGDAVTVKVELELNLEWEPNKRPTDPKEGTRVYVKDNRVALGWKVSENTKDKGIRYFSSYLVTHNGKPKEWSKPQHELNTILTGPDGSEIPEGDYRIQLVAQDELGTPAYAVGRADLILETTFTVDHTPPLVAYNPVDINADTKVPTLSVNGTDNYIEAANIVYQFRVIPPPGWLFWIPPEETPWSNWEKNTSYSVADRPIKFYSWGYQVEVKARDVVGNESRYPVRYSLLWYERSPWMLYTVVGLIALIIMLVVFFLISGMLERSRNRKRAAARKAAAQKPSEAESQPTPTQPQPQPSKTDDLFGVAPSPFGTEGSAFSTPSTSGDNLFGSTTAFDFGSGMTDVFGTPPTPVEEPPRTTTSVQSDEIDLFGPSSLTPAPTVTTPSVAMPVDPFAPTPTQKKEHDWSAEDKVELSDHDLFDPI